MVPPGQNSCTTMDPELRKDMDQSRVRRQFPLYGATDGGLTSDNCPTCQGTGRIPRGQENQLVAVIPCNDVRLKPRRTMLHVIVSMVVCLLICCLILFFLFPRSVTLTPVSVLSVTVFFTPASVEMEVKNLINISNENFVPVQITNFTMQGLIVKTVMGKTKMTNMTALQPRSKKSYTIEIDLSISDKGLAGYCQSGSFPIHTLFLELQMTMNIFYLSHTEQITSDTFAYIDCGANSTKPHPLNHIL